MALVYRQGKKFDPRTARMVDALAREYGAFDIVQGSYSGGVGASAGTHDRGGALDASDSGMSKAQRTAFVAAARRIGWAMWHRPDRAGVWSSHFHGIAIQPGGKTDRGVLSVGAHNQVIDYYEGRDGLAGNSRDPHAALNIAPITFEQYLEGDEDMPLSDADVKRVADAVAAKLKPSFTASNERDWRIIRRIDELIAKVRG